MENGEVLGELQRLRAKMDHHNAELVEVLKVLDIVINGLLRGSRNPAEVWSAIVELTARELSSCARRISTLLVV